MRTAAPAVHQDDPARPDGPSVEGTDQAPASGAHHVPLWTVPVLIAALTRGLYWAAVHPAWVPRSDAAQYVGLARSLAAGDGFTAAFPSGVAHATAFRPPLYPALLAVPTAVFGPDALWPGRLLSLLIGLAVVALTVVYVRRIAGDRAGFAAGLAVALLPSLIVNDTITLTEPLGLLLVVGILLALDDRRWILSGALTGLLLLTRPNAYLVVAVMAVVVWRTVGLRRAAAAVGICLVVVAPWAVRNAVQVGTPKLATSDGFTLAAIYGPPAQETGGFFDPTVAPWFRRNGVTALERDEAAWSNRLVAIAVDGVRDRPSSVLDRMWSGAGTMLELPGHRAEEAEWVDGRSITFRDATLWLFPLIVVAGSIGTVLRIRDRRTWPAIAIVGQFVAVSLVLVSVPRLRGPFDLLMCFGVGYLWGWVTDRRSATPVG